MYLFIRCQGVKGAKSVFGNHKRFVVAVVQIPQHVFHADGVDCPVPVRSVQLRIGTHFIKAGMGFKAGNFPLFTGTVYAAPGNFLTALRTPFRTFTGVIIQRQEIGNGCRVRQKFQISFLHHRSQAMLLQINLRRFIVMPLKIHICVVVVPKCLCILHSHNILRCTAQRINGAVA